MLAALLHWAPSSSDEIDFSFLDKSLPLEQRVETLVSQMSVEEKISQLLDEAPAIPRLGVPAYGWWNEALHGVARNGKATIFPQMIGMAATFDVELTERVASAISTEARAKYALAQTRGNHGKYAGLTFWSPNVNIFRDPRWGRGQETFGEDPFLTSRMGIAFVQGLQGDDPVHLKAAAAAKHFLVHSGPENIRHEFDAVPSKQDLAETYIPAFEALVTEAGVEGVMAAYNAVYGTPMVANEYFLQDALRQQWEFDGYITSDCGAVAGAADRHRYRPTVAEAAAEALKAGTNLNCGTGYRNLTQAFEAGLVTEELIHTRTRQLFKTRFRLGMFDDPASVSYSSIGPQHIHSEKHVALAREAARKSIVLLKNRNNILPLSKNTRVPYLTGPFANSADMLMGSYYGVTSSLVTILEGITDALAPGTSLNYRSGALPFHDNINPKNYAPFVAAYSDVTIAVVGLTADREGEEVDAIASDHEGDKRDLQLPANQVAYINQLVDFKKEKPLILVVASGSPVSLEGIEEHCDAILQIWYPGEQGGNAVADVLFGDYSPSGHLPLTFPRNITQVPRYDDYSMRGRTYKYMTEEPAYPFGFGLTYSKTEFGDIRLNTLTPGRDRPLNVEVTVSNAGDYDIDEVVQVYVSPVHVSGGIPRHSLKAFKRIALAAGEKKKVTFSLDPESLKVVDENGERTWRLGEYRISVGNSSPGDLSTRLGAAVPQQAVIALK
jgi:beta-glucosidase